LLNGNGDIDLLLDDYKHHIELENLQPWQIDQLIAPIVDSSSVAYSTQCLINIDKICSDWIESLTLPQWEKIKRQGSLFGIPLPPQWIKVWRFILKEPDLRDTWKGSRGGINVGSVYHVWSIWSTECIEKYLNELDKDLLKLLDMGLPYLEIGEIMLAKYGDAFWKKRKQNSKTTPAQVVNNYLYWKLPQKICRKELTDMVLSKIKYINNKYN